jgi:hypothetical protein
MADAEPKWPRPKMTAIFTFATQKMQQHRKGKRDGPVKRQILNQVQEVRHNGYDAE